MKCGRAPTKLRLRRNRHRSRRLLRDARKVWTQAGWCAWASKPADAEIMQMQSVSFARCWPAIRMMSPRARAWIRRHEARNNVEISPAQSKKRLECALRQRDYALTRQGCARPAGDGGRGGQELGSGRRALRRCGGRSLRRQSACGSRLAAVVGITSLNHVRPTASSPAPAQGLPQQLRHQLTRA